VPSRPDYGAQDDERTIEGALMDTEKAKEIVERMQKLHQMLIVNADALNDMDALPVEYDFNIGPDDAVPDSRTIKIQVKIFTE